MQNLEKESNLNLIISPKQKILGRYVASWFNHKAALELQHWLLESSHCAIKFIIESEKLYKIMLLFVRKMVKMSGKA